MNYKIFPGKKFTTLSVSAFTVSDINPATYNRLENPAVLIQQFQLAVNNSE